MRILTLTNWYPPHYFGGYELSCFDVMTRLAKRGHDIEVLCSDQRVAGVDDATTAHEAHVRRELQLYLQDDRLLRPSLRQRRGSKKSLVADCGAP